jgi:hypothetical protein
MNFPIPRWLSLVTVAVFLIGCGGSSDEKAAVPEPANEPSAAAPEPKAPKRPTYWSDITLHQVIRDTNVGYSGNGQFQIDQQGQPEAISLGSCGITSIEAFRGLPLKLLDLQGCPITDISAVEGMPLVELYLDSTNVEDLSALEGNTTLRKLYVDNTKVKDLTPIKQAPIQELNLVKSRVTNIDALEDQPLRMLWLTDLAVKDIRPLRKCPLESLTLHRTLVEDLKPLENHPYLMRLHIGEAPVRDLTPLAGLRLTRLVFTPATVEKGIDEVRTIPTMTEIGTQFEDQANTLMPPAVFWPKYDAGEFK